MTTEARKLARLRVAARLRAALATAKKALPSATADLLVLSGSGVVGWGAYLFHPGAGFVVWGIAAVWTGFLLDPPTKG